MLVLTRKPGESIVIGDVIEVKVISVEGDAVRLGIQAPHTISVYRREVYESVRAENLRALRDATDLGRKLPELLQAKETEDGGGEE